MAADQEVAAEGSTPSIRGKHEGSNDAHDEKEFSNNPPLLRRSAAFKAQTSSDSRRGHLPLADVPDHAAVSRAGPVLAKHSSLAAGAESGTSGTSGMSTQLDGHTKQPHVAEASSGAFHASTTIPHMQQIARDTRPQQRAQRSSEHGPTLSTTATAMPGPGLRPLEEASRILNAALAGKDPRSISAAIHAAVRALGSADSADVMLPEVSS